MNKSAFLAALSEHLSALPQSEIEKTLSYYDEIINDRMEEGMSEEEAVNGLEPPDVIAGRILQETPISVLMKERIRPRRSMSALGIVLIVLGAPVWLSLLIAVLAIAFSIYVAVWSVVLSVWAVALALGASSIVAAIAAPFRFAEGTHMGLMTMGVALFCAGACIFVLFAAWHATRGMIAATVCAGKKIKSKLIRGGRSNEER